MKTILFLVVLLISCDDKVKITIDFDYQKFDREKALWDSSKPNDYEYHISSSGGGEYIPVNTHIIVENGKYKEQEPQTKYGQADEYYQIIDNIYDTIAKTYKYYKDTEQSKDDMYLTKIKIEYN